jgi:hypothetical protein
MTGSLKGNVRGQLQKSGTTILSVALEPRAWDRDVTQGWIKSYAASVGPGMCLFRISGDADRLRKIYPQQAWNCRRGENDITSIAAGTAQQLGIQLLLCVSICSGQAKV